MIRTILFLSVLVGIGLVLTLALIVWAAWAILN